jgi:hypothetical protein
MQRPRGAAARLDEFEQARREEQFLPSLEARERDPPYALRTPPSSNVKASRR